MTRILNWLGLMRVSEHERAKLKSAADDQLIAKLTRTSRRLHMLVECRNAEVADLRPDAQRWRDRQRRERERGQRRKGK